jgi:hypothetical protein
MRTLRDYVEEFIGTERDEARRELARAYVLGRQVYVVGKLGHGSHVVTARRLRRHALRSGCTSEMSALLVDALRADGGVASPERLERLEPRLVGLGTYAGFVRMLLDEHACRDVCRVRDQGRTTFLSAEAVLAGAPKTRSLPYATPFAEQVRVWLRSMRWEHLMFVMARYVHHPFARRWLDAKEDHQAVRDLQWEVAILGGRRLRLVAPLLAASLRKHGSPLFVPILELVEPWFDGVASHAWVLDFMADDPTFPRAVAPLERDGLRYVDVVAGSLPSNDVVLS